MSKEYSIYEAKSRLSELLRVVKTGKQVVITDRGKAVAVVSPVEDNDSFESRIDQLRMTGQIEKKGDFPNLPKLKVMPDALQQLLDDREEK